MKAAKQFYELYENKVKKQECAKTKHAVERIKNRLMYHVTVVPTLRESLDFLVGGRIAPQVVARLRREGFEARVSRRMSNDGHTGQTVPHAIIKVTLRRIPA
jgi:hypothetical protein